MRKYIDEKELSERIELNLRRLSDDPYYGIEGVFSPAEYDWPADKEGRALLAFMSHFKISGVKIPCMEKMLSKMTEKMNPEGYFGPVAGETIFEQQLSGHSWLLRGLCEHYERFGDDYSLYLAKNITEKLYLPTAGKYASYPVCREKHDIGGVSGSNSENIGAWRLSSDIGCAFMSIDGLSHFYKITKDGRVLSLLDEMTKRYTEIDKRAIKAQTHCTLTAARGMMRLYFVTGNRKYLDEAKEIYILYVNGGGMSYTYQNLNWWGRPGTWTEPCAIVDSLMLAAELFRAEGKEEYRKTAARIFHNGLASAERDNGGAGTDSIVCENGNDDLYIKSYEAPFCCSMRLAEGLFFISENKDILYADFTGNISKNEGGVYSDGDIIYGEVSEEGRDFAESIINFDGHMLSPLLKYYRIPRTLAMTIRQRIIFR